MLTKAFVVGGKDISRIRGEIAHILSEKGITQREISKLLDITQPMVSRYLQQRTIVSPASKRIAEHLLQNKHMALSYVFTKRIEEGKDYFLTTKEHVLSKEKTKLIEELTNNIERLRNKNFSSLLSKVKINIATALEHAQQPEDILAIPSGLIFVNNKLYNYAEPEFGSSNHLSTLLLSLRKKSVMNIKYSETLLKKIKKEKLSYSFLNDNYTPTKDAPILIHKGSFGIEPTTYLFGKSSKEVVDLCLRLL